MLLLRFASGALIFACIILLARDEVHGLAAHSLAITSVAELLMHIFGSSLDLGRDSAGIGPHSEIADSVLRTALNAPAWLVTGIPGVLLLLLSRRGVASPAAGSAAGLRGSLERRPGPTPASIAHRPAAMTAAPSSPEPETRRETPAPNPVAMSRALPAVASGPMPATIADREFLPAALEILHTPPSPIGTKLLLYICGVFLLALAWSYFGWLDIYAVAPGKIQPSGRSKVVQPVYPGTVTAIYVRNGSHVDAGDLLLELDPTEAEAERGIQARALQAARAEGARRQVAIAQARAGALEPAPIDFSPDIDQLIRRREESVLAADLEQLAASMASLEAQLAEKRATKERLTSSIDARQKIVALAKERVDMRETLAERGAGSRALVIEAQEQLETQVVTDTGERGQLLETSAAVDTLQRKVGETMAQFIATQSQKLEECERERDKLTQELVKAQAKRNFTRLTAPTAGTVQQLAVTTVGQVVASGQPLLTIVPFEGPIEIEALITNSDIGFVEPGQPAVVKIDAFPFTRYGTIEGTVSIVSHDAVDERFAAELSDAANAAKPQGTQGAASTHQLQTQNLVFPAVITLARRSIAAEKREVSLMPGMSVMVEIKRGQRRVIDYLWSPLRQTVSQAAHER